LQGNPARAQARFSTSAYFTALASNISEVLFYRSSKSLSGRN